MSLRINQQLRNPVGLAQLLAKIIRGISVRQPDYIEDSVRFFLNQDFSIEGENDARFTADKALIINPLATESGQIAPKTGDPQSLTLHDVYWILQQVYRELLDTNFQQKEVLILSNERATEFNDLLKDAYKDQIEHHRETIENNTTSIPDKEVALTEIAEELLKTIQALLTEEVETETGEILHRSTVIPEWLRQAKEIPLRQKEHWEVIKEVITVEDEKETGYLEVAIRQFQNIPVNRAAEFPGVRLKTEEETISIIALRNFLNEWAKAIIEEDQRDPFPYRRVFSAEILRNNLRLFPSKTTNSAEQQDLEVIQDLDKQAVASFKKWLLQPLEEFKKKKPTILEPVGTKAGEDGGAESEQDQQNKAPLPKTPEDQAKLKDQLLEHQHYLQQEALRLQVISANFVLALNNFPRPLPPELEGSEAFVYLQREITAEIMDMLNKDATALDDPNRRSMVVRTFLFRLMASPKFQAYLAVMKENYISLEISKVPDLTPEQQAALKAQLIDKLNKQPTSDLDSLLTTLVSQVAPIAGAPKNDFNPQSLSKAHFVELLSFYGLTPEQQENIFEGTDLLMYMRTSSERIARFTPEQFERIFGISLNDFNDQQRTELFELLGVYLNLRRGWFEHEYKAASVTQAQDIPYNTSALTPEELDEYLRKKELIKASGVEARHFVRASMLTKSQMANFENTGHAEVKETKAAEEAILQDRREIYAKVARELAAADPEYQKFLAQQAGIQFRADQELTERQKRDFLALIEAAADLSPFELESGIVTDGLGEVIRTPEQAEQSFRNNQTPRFTNTSLSVAKKVAEEGAAALGGALIGAALPGVGFLVPKQAKKAVGGAALVGGAIAAGGLIYTIQKVGEFLSHFGIVGMGGIAGGAMGAFAASGGGPIAMVFGAAGGALAGAGGTALVSNGGLSTGGLFGTTAPAAQTAAAAATQAPLLAKAAGAFKSLVTGTPAGVAVGSFVGIAAVGTIIVYTQLTTAFLPPPETAFGPGIQNKYVNLSKTADPNAAPAPQKVNYTIQLDVKTGYKIEITNITDTFVVKSKDPNKKLTVSQSTNFDQFKTTLDPASGSASLTIPYSIDFDSNYQDSLINNTFQITFNATDNGAVVQNSTSATASVCFGDCPKPAAGCWPTTGRIGQDPFGPYDHNPYSEDAFDIMAPIGTPIYAPFPGNVCAKENDGYWSPDGVSGGGYGHMLYLYEDQAAGGYTFTFGHLSKYADSIVPGSCSTGDGRGIHVNAGDLIGFVGNSGHSSGPHLHYQVGPEHNPNRTSLLRTLIPAKDKNISVSLPPAQRQIVSCYDSSATGIAVP